MDRMRFFPLTKIISIALVFTLLNQQILFAADYSYGIPVENEKNRSGFMSVDELDKAQRRQEELIARLQASLDSKLSGGVGDESEWTLQRKSGTSSEGQDSAVTPSAQDQTVPLEVSQAEITVTTAAGDHIAYSGGAIARIEQPNGTIIEDVVLTPTGELERGLIRFVDGGVLTIEGGRACSYLGPDGTATHYRQDGLVDSEVTPDGLVSYYSYLFDDAGSIARTTITRPEEIIEYDESGRLSKVTKLDGTEIGYENGIISQMTKGDGSKYVFGRILNGPDIEVKIVTYFNNSGYRVDFDSVYNVVSVTSPSGSFTKYGHDRTPLYTRKDNALIAYDNTGQIAYAICGVTGFDGTYRQGQDGYIAVPLATIDELARAIEDLDSAARALADAEDACAKRQLELTEAMQFSAQTFQAYQEADTSAQQAETARRAAEAALMSTLVDVETQFAYGDDVTEIEDQKVVLREQFGIFNTTLWYRTSSAYAQCTSGRLFLCGTGTDTRAHVHYQKTFGEYTFARMGFDFKVDSLTGSFKAGLQSASSSTSFGNSLQTACIEVREGKICIDIVQGQLENQPTAVLLPKVNTDYSCLFELKNGYLNIYVWEKEEVRPAEALYSFRTQNWPGLRPFFEVRSGCAWVGNVMLHAPLDDRIYDVKSQLAGRMSYHDDYATRYEYRQAGTSTLTDLDTFNRLTRLWESGSSVTSGRANVSLSGLRMRSYLPRTIDQTYSFDFALGTVYSNARAGLEGKEATGNGYLRFVVQSGRLSVVTVCNDHEKTVAVSPEQFLPLQQYTAQFEVKAGAIDVYVWRKGDDRPAIPLYSFTDPSWSALRFYAKTDSGRFVIDEFSRTQTCGATGQEADTVVAHLRDMFDAERSAIVNREDARGRYEAALTQEGQAKDALTIAENGHASALTQEEQALHALEGINGALNVPRVIPDQPLFYETCDRVIQDMPAVVLYINENFASEAGISYVTYWQNGLPKEACKFDGSTVTFDEEGALLSFKGQIIDASYASILGPCKSVTGEKVVRDGLTRIYDARGKLSALMTGENTHIEYRENEIVSIATGDGVKRLYEAGTLTELIDKDGATFSFDASGKAVRSVDRFGNVYDYAYGYDPVDGEETVIIFEETTGLRRFYKSGVLYHTEDLAGVTSDNLYDADGRLTEVLIKNYDTVVGRYSYTYLDSGKTGVSDLLGNTRTYACDGRLETLVDKDNNVFQYTYPDSVTTRLDWVPYEAQQAPAADFVIAQEFVNDALRKVVRADGTVTTYRVGGDLDSIQEGSGKTIIQYLYDEAGELEGVDLRGSREDLSRAVQDARTEIEAEKNNTIKKIETQRDSALSNIFNQYVPQFLALFNQLSTLSDQLSALTGHSYGIFFEVTIAQHIAGLDPADPNIPIIKSLVQQLQDVNNQQLALLAQKAAEQKPIEDEATRQIAEIERQADQEVAKIDAQIGLLSLDISRREGAAFVLYYHRKILGRDLSRPEADAWVSQLSADKQKFTREEVVGTILSSAEYADRKAWVASIKKSVRHALEGYLLMTEQEKDTFLVMLGLSRQDAARLNRYDVEKILSWIDSQGLHFGQSAFLALKNVLEANGVVCDLEDLAINAILIDILSGAIDSLAKGDLALSMFALSTCARTKGVALFNAKLIWEDIAQLPSPRFIALVDGNHYIVVTGVEGDEVYYREENRGPAGTDEVMTKDEFIKTWSGYAIVVQAKGLSLTEPIPEPIASKLITSQEARAVKGACIGLFVAFVIWAVSAVLTVVATVASVIATIVTTVVSAIAAVVSQFATVITALGAKLVSGISTAFTGIGQMIGSVAGASIASMATAALKTVASIGLSFGISAGLKALGVNTTITNLTSAFLTGGILGLINPVAGISMLGSFMMEGMKYATIAGINEAGVALRLDPAITNLMAITSGALVGGVWRGNIGQTLVTIAPSVASEAAYIGMQSVGNLLGIDPRISYLAGVGIRSTLNAGLTHDFMPDVIWGGVQSGLLRGITSIGINYATQELGINPFIANLSAAAMAGGIEGLLEGRNPIEGIFDTYFRAGIGLLTLGGDGGNNPWLRAAYISQVLDFSQIIQERGIVNALDTYATGFLHQQTINEIWKQGGIAELLTKPNQIEITTNNKGEVVKRIYTMVINSNSDKLISNYIDLSPTYDMLVGYREGNIITHCEFVIGPDGRPQLKNGEKEILGSDGSKKVDYVENFNLTKRDIIDPSGNKTGYYIPVEGTNSIIIGENDQIISGKFVSLVSNYNITSKDGSLYDYTGSELIGIDSYFLEDYLGLDEDDDLQLDDISINISKLDLGYDVSVGLVDPTKQSDLDALSAVYKVASFIKDTYLPAGFITSEDLNLDGYGYIEHSYGNNVYAVIDIGSGYKPVEMNYNGLHLIGDRDKVGIGQSLNPNGYTSVINGEVRYDIDANTYLTARIDNGLPTSIKYNGSTDMVQYEGSYFTDGTLDSGELLIAGRDVIIIQDGIPTLRYNVNNPSGSLTSIDCEGLISLFTNIQIQKGQVSLPGIYNALMNSPEADFTAYANEIFNARNLLSSDGMLSYNEAIAIYCNSENAMNAEEFLNISKLYYTLRDPVAVYLNQFFHQVTDEVRTKFDDSYAQLSGYNSLDGFSYIMESGSKTAGIGQINKDGLRVYSIIGVSANMSEKIFNPYVKFFVNFTTNNEVTDMLQPLVDYKTIPGINHAYQPEDIFRNPTSDKQVWNVEFDDIEVNSTLSPVKDYMHVDYARNTDHPYHEIFVALSAAAEIAVYDGGETFKSIIMKAKGFTDGSSLNQYLQQNGRKIDIGIDDNDRWKQN